MSRPTPKPGRKPAPKPAPEPGSHPAPNAGGAGAAPSDPASPGSHPGPKPGLTPGPKPGAADPAIANPAADPAPDPAPAPAAPNPAADPAAPSDTPSSSDTAPAADPPAPPPARDPLARAIRACRLCADRFAATATAHAPRPVVWFRPGARLLIIGQAPGARVHASGVPFDDPSGRRLREWMGIDRATFYDHSRIAITPMAFCFPGHDARGADLPPPPVCARTWAGRVRAALGPVPLTLLVGGHAQRWHLDTRAGVTETVARWRDHAPAVFALPHPSWRNTGWLKKNPWFATELLPALRARVKEVLDD